MESPQAPGWYDDPDGAAQLRYFDGIVWSDRRVPKHVPRPAPPAGAVPGADVFGRPVGGVAPRPHGPGHEVFGHQSYAPQGVVARTADGQPLASFGQRAAAYLLDMAILTLLNLLLAGWAGWLWIKPYMEEVVAAAQADDPARIESLTPGELFGLFDWRWFAVYLTISLLVSGLYHVLLVGRRGATVGKSALGIQVRRTDRPGPPGIAVASRRYLLPLAMALLSVVPVISFLLAVVGLADLLWPLHDARRQALHDKIAGTQVVDARRG